VGAAGVTGPAGSAWRVVDVPAEATWPLRHLVLRADRAEHSPRLRADSARSTRHFAVLDASGPPIGVATMTAQACPAPSPTSRDPECPPVHDTPSACRAPADIVPASGPALRLAMMAVHPDWQRRGIGTAR